MIKSMSERNIELTMTANLIDTRRAAMPRNEGTIDRILRVAVGLAILSLAFIGPKTPWAYLGLLPLITGLVGFCPAYALFGWRTCRPKSV
jgi:hypothetical protein